MESDVVVLASCPQYYASISSNLCPHIMSAPLFALVLPPSARHMSLPRRATLE